MSAALPHQWNGAAQKMPVSRHMPVVDDAAAVRPPRAGGVHASPAAYSAGDAAGVALSAAERGVKPSPQRTCTPSSGLGAPSAPRRAADNATSSATRTRSAGASSCAKRQRRGAYALLSNAYQPHQACGAASTAAQSASSPLEQQPASRSTLAFTCGTRRRTCTLPHQRHVVRWLRTRTCTRLAAGKRAVLRCGGEGLARRRPRAPPGVAQQRPVSTQRQAGLKVGVQRLCGGGFRKHRTARPVWREQQLGPVRLSGQRAASVLEHLVAPPPEPAKARNCNAALGRRRGRSHVQLPAQQRSTRAAAKRISEEWALHWSRDTSSQRPKHARESQLILYGPRSIESSRRASRRRQSYSLL